MGISSSITPTVGHPRSLLDDTAGSRRTSLYLRCFYRRTAKTRSLAFDFWVPRNLASYGCSGSNSPLRSYGVRSATVRGVGEIFPGS